MISDFHIDLTEIQWQIICHTHAHIKMFCSNPLETNDFMTSNEFMLTHAQNLIYILDHNKLKKYRLISNIIFFTIETDILIFLTLEWPRMIRRNKNSPYNVDI